MPFSQLDPLAQLAAIAAAEKAGYKLSDGLEIASVEGDFVALVDDRTGYWYYINHEGERLGDTAPWQLSVG